MPTYESHGNILLNQGPEIGTASVPDILFLNSSNSGFFLKSAGVIAVSIAGTEVFNFSASGGSEVGQLILADGTAAAPSLAWGGTSSNTGLFLKATDSIGVSLNGTERASFSSAGVLTLTAGVAGSATNDSAAAGIVGQELITLLPTASAVALTTATAATVITQSITAGDWEVDGVIVYKPAATTSVTLSAAAISTTTDAVPAIIGQPTANQVLIQNATAAQVPVTDFCVNIPPMRVSLSATTNVFLVAKATFSVDTLAAYGMIRARRVR